MLNQGVYLAPSAYEAGFVSSAHGKKEIEKTKLRDQQAELITKMKAAQDAEREQLRKEAADAVAVAKEKQRL